MGICRYCQKEIVGRREDAKYCNDAHKDAYHNFEKTQQLILPECFRVISQEYALAWDKTLKETIATIYSRGLKWPEHGHPITDDQIWADERKLEATGSRLAAPVACQKAEKVSGCVLPQTGGS